MSSGMEIKDWSKSWKVIEPTFEETRTVGNIAKELVRALLEGSEYTIFPFGYESYFTHIKDLIHQRKLKRSEVIDQIASMPDLVVLDEELGDISLVEVKYRNRPPSNVSINTRIIERCIRFWPNSILVYVLPFKHVFYAKEISKLEIDRTKEITDIVFTDNDFIEYLFPRISGRKEKIEKLQALAKDIFKNVSTGLRVEFIEE